MTTNDQYRPDQYADDQRRPDQYVDDQRSPDQFTADQYSADQPNADQYKADQYQSDQYQGDQYQGDQYQADRVAADQYPQDQYRPETTAAPDQGVVAGNYDRSYDEPFVAEQQARSAPTAVHESTQGRESLSSDQTTNAQTTGDHLFADDDLSGFRTHWDEVQASFVDDPQQCVRQADTLVSDVVEKLTTSFTTTRTRLEAQWAGGEEVSTEDLRVALQQYREFFQRLLSV